MGKRLGKNGMWAHTRGVTVAKGLRGGVWQRLVGQIQSERLEGKKSLMETRRLVQLKLFQLLGRMMEV